MRLRYTLQVLFLTILTGVFFKRLMGLRRSVNITATYRTVSTSFVVNKMSGQRASEINIFIQLISDADRLSLLNLS